MCVNLLGFSLQGRRRYKNLCPEFKSASNS